ncbi:MAG: trypsin-like peptidase domain-containing protein [Verrucomicrobia bacterium]|nr:trypsin-like peptidase domain-containing protein [Verrucomicrobiota bacterium]
MSLFSHRWACALLAALFAAAPVWASDDLKDEIVKIYTVANIPDYWNPWNMRGTASGTGSGAILKGKKILTNAHVVGNETFIQVRRAGDARRYRAHVLAAAHEVDLALLTVDDPSFWDEQEGLDLGELPNAQDEVFVYGFPMGGDTLSVTKGVISRIEHQNYAHSSFAFLAGQLDAAINPGNSGGPVIKDGKIVGVVMQGMRQADNIGYMVPVSIIQQLFEDLEDGTYDGFPSLGVSLQGMENRDLKRSVHMPQDLTGMRVFRINPGSPAEGVMHTNDVIVTIEGAPVADDGTVEFRPRERTSLSYFIQNKRIGESIALEVWRDGARIPLNIKLTRPLTDDQLVPNERYDVLPTYYIIGGIVFSPLTRNLLQMWGANWYNNAPNGLTAVLNNNFPEVDGEQVIVALKLLSADINQGYDNINNWIVTTVDGKRVHSMKELIAAVEYPDGDEFVTFSNDAGQVVTLDRAKALASRDQILNTYRIASDRSPDLMDTAQ